MGITFFALNEKYLHGELKGKASYIKFCQIYRQYFAGWTEHPTRDQIKAWHKPLPPAHGNKALGYLKAMYNWAIEERLWTEESPAARVKRHRTKRRKRVLLLHELAALMNVLEWIFPKSRILLVVLLTTGCRLSEALTMQWSDVDLRRGVWRKPITKNGEDQIMPLPRQTCAALAQLQNTNKPCPFVFRGVYGRHLSRCQAEKMWSILRRMTFKCGERWPALNMPDVHLHDFRRTLATRLGKQGCNGYLIQSILNHCREQPSDTTAVYVIPSFEEQQEALQQHADTLFSLIQETPQATQGSFPFIGLPTHGTSMNEVSQ